MNIVTRSVDERSGIWPLWYKGGKGSCKSLHTGKNGPRIFCQSAALPLLLRMLGNSRPHSTINLNRRDYRQIDFIDKAPVAGGSHGASPSTGGLTCRVIVLRYWSRKGAYGEGCGFAFAMGERFLWTFKTMSCFRMGSTTTRRS